VIQSVDFFLAALSLTLLAKYVPTEVGNQKGSPFSRGQALRDSIGTDPGYAEGFAEARAIQFLIQYPFLIEYSPLIKL
jgi:hypothetical protein